MNDADKIARYEEIERRGLLNQLPVEKQEAWAEYKRRNQHGFTPSAEALAQVRTNNEAYAKRQEENRPWVDKNPVGRLGVAVTQGIANSSLNPAGYIARAAGMDTRPFEPQNAAERIGELAGQYGFDAAVMATGLGGAAEAGMGGTGVAGNVIKTMAQGGVPLALTGSTGSAIATGAINPQNQYARMFTDLLGGGISTSMAARPKIQVADRNDIKSIKQLTSEIGKDALDDNISEAQRTGRSLLEVGNDEIIQAGQRARQQTPEARKIFNERIAEIAEAQPARMRGAIDEALGTKGKNATIAQVMENAKAEAQPIYKELDNIGDLAAYETKDIPEQNFKRWFEGSQVVDENGQPRRYYHGTPKKFDAFDKDKIVRGNGFWFTDDMNYASSVRANEGNPTVLETYLNAKNPIDVNKNREDFIKLSKEYFGNSRDFSDVGDNFIIGEAMSDKGFPGFLKSKGYDAIKMGNGIEVFEPNQIKSVNNSGAWSSSPSLSDAGWKPESQLANAIKNNDVLADTISRVKRANSSLKNLPDTDFRVVNEARKALSQASMNRTELSGYEARQALNELDPILNNITGGKLAQANKLYSDAYQFERAADLGRDVFNSRKSPDDLKAAWNSLSSTEKQAARIGLRDELLNKIGSSTNESVATKKFLPQNVREKMAAIAGKENADKIIDEAEQSVKSMRNINKFIGGSQTSEKQRLRDVAKGLRGFIRNPWEKTVDAVFSPFDNARNVRMAQYLTDPNIVNAYNSVLRQQQINNAMIPLRDIYLQNLMRTGLENQ